MTNFNIVQNSFLTTDLKTILKQALQNTSEYISQFRFDAAYTTKLETAFGSDFNQQIANSIFDKLAQEDFSGIPTIEIVNRNDINGANGAFAIATLPMGTKSFKRYLEWSDEPQLSNRTLF